jgi:hypothetical protein
MRPNWAYNHRLSMQIHYYGLNHPSQIMQKLEDRTAVFILKNLRTHNNPVKRGLVKEPGDWPWSSWRSHFLRDASLLAMDRVP